MAKRHVWGVQPLWVLGVGLVLTAGLLLRGDDRWIALVTVTAIARLAESIDQRFTHNHIYLVLALVGSVFLLVEGFKRGQPGSEPDR